jgi:hypothetical protein
MLPEFNENSLCLMSFTIFMDLQVFFISPAISFIDSTLLHSAVWNPPFKLAVVHFWALIIVVQQDTDKMTTRTSLVIFKSFLLRILNLTDTHILIIINKIELSHELLVFFSFHLKHCQKSESAYEHIT